ncbi:MAG: [FeFe] hydrogenase, group A [Clostridiales Family XIII bacterium]|jgi:NADP-reducing hydrogenase subunit HndD|nr:[FeFe] hydrogenase, group A [Clostridiales Family XIII bacterium]
MEQITIKVNGVDYQVDGGQSVLDACHSIGIHIPTLCWMRGLNEIGACRMCVVELKGAKRLITACVYPVKDGMELTTNSLVVQKARKMNLELLLSSHDQNCLSCSRSTDCELQALCKEYDVDGMKFIGTKEHFEKETSTLHLVRDNNKCILCRRCVSACQHQYVGVISPADRGFETHIACAFEAPLAETGCVSCGQCIVNCPTGALMEKDDTDKVLDAINDPEKTVVVQTAPSIRATIGEAFGFPIGTNTEGKMVAALRRLGFDQVFDTDTAADITIWEEANEFIERVKNNGTLPLLTSCCPGWTKFLEMYHPEFFNNISSCKSPQGMMGGLIKTYWAEKNEVDTKNLVVVSIMPCTAKKFELDRYDMHAAGEGIQDNDISLTTRELVKLIRRAGLDFANLPDEKFDEALGDSSGASVIFGASGGVLEAALRTAASWISGEELANPEFVEVRGEEGIKEATYNVAGIDVNVCSVSGLEGVEKVLRQVRDGEKSYHIIEIMACPGGCVNGGGQPSQPAKVRNFIDLKELRAKALYDEDVAKAVRVSHKNELVMKLYDEYLEKPGSHKAHDILHTTYQLRQRNY